LFARIFHSLKRYVPLSPQRETIQKSGWTRARERERDGGGDDRVPLLLFRVSRAVGSPTETRVVVVVFFVSFPFFFVTLLFFPRRQTLSAQKGKNNVNSLTPRCFLAMTSKREIKRKALFDVDAKPKKRLGE